VPDCECQCFIPAHTQRADEITVLEEESDALADEIAALRTALKGVEREAVTYLEERNAAEARVERLEKALLEVRRCIHDSNYVDEIAAAALEKKP
jgi:chromosome segregation ATPase